MILRKWLEWVLIRLFRKMLPLDRFIEALRSISERGLYELMQPKIEEYSDEELDEVIRSFKEKDYGEFPPEYFDAIEKAGYNRIVLQWLETEKFLREHRKKYHPELKGG